MPIRPDRSDLGTGACKLRARGTCAICFHTEKVPVRCVTFTLKIWVPGSAVMLLVYLHKKSKSPYPGKYHGTYGSPATGKRDCSFSCFDGCIDTFV